MCHQRVVPRQACVCAQTVGAQRCGQRFELLPPAVKIGVQIETVARGTRQPVIELKQRKQQGPAAFVRYRGRAYQCGGCAAGAVHHHHQAGSGSQENSLVPSARQWLQENFDAQTPGRSDLD